MAIVYTKKDQGRTISVCDSIPVHSALLGDEAVDISTGKKYIYVSSTWTELGAGGGSGTAGLIDLSSVTGAGDKVDLTSVTSQSRLGYGITFKAGSAISCGQPVIYNYASGVATAITAGALPSQHEVIGIALEDALSGASVNVLTQGFATARRDTTFAASAETVLLDNITTGTSRQLTNATTFRDSGDNGANYSNSENYSISFDATVGYTADIIVNNIGFEHTNFSMYDRLGVQGSNDGVTYVNLSISWLLRSATATPPWSSSYGSPDTPGYIFPRSQAEAQNLGSGTFPVTINTGYRYLRFYFRSDSSTNALGWDMTLQPDTPYTTAAITVAEGTPLYLDSADFTKVTTDNTSQIIVGYAAYENTENNSIFIRV